MYYFFPATFSFNSLLLFFSEAFYKPFSPFPFSMMFSGLKWFFQKLNEVRRKKKWWKNGQWRSNNFVRTYSLDLLSPCCFIKPQSFNFLNPSPLFFHSTSNHPCSFLHTVHFSLLWITVSMVSCVLRKAGNKISSQNVYVPSHNSKEWRGRGAFFLCLQGAALIKGSCHSKSMT